MLYTLPHSLELVLQLEKEQQEKVLGYCPLQLQLEQQEKELGYYLL